MPFHPSIETSRLVLQTMYNVRDLGGIPTADGRTTAFGQFVRSDAPTRLNQADLQFLLDYPVRTVIDLRCDDELNGGPHPLRDQPGIQYFHIPILGNNLDVAMKAVRPTDPEKHPPGLSDLYISAMEQSKPEIGRVFSLLANARKGAALFHCSLGKDRTGLVASLLLLLANVDDQDIIDHYSVSSIYLKPYIDTFIHKINQKDHHFFLSDPENMKRTLSYFRQHYNSPETYLSSCGLSPEDITSLRRKMMSTNMPSGS